MKYLFYNLAATLVISSMPLSAWAFTIFDTNTTIDSRIDGGIVIMDGDMPPTIVEIVEGANIFDGGEILDSSIVNFRDGAIHSDSDEVNSPAFTVLERSTLNVFGGSLRSDAEEAIFALDNSSVNIHGGSISGEFYSLTATEESTINIHDGLFLKPVFALDNSILNIFGGDLTHGFDLGNRIRGSAIANIYGGIFGGSGKALSVNEHGTLNLYGGQFVSMENSITLSATGQAATLNVFGTDLEIVNKRLQGVLSDGSLINIDIKLTDGPTVNLHIVPEPSAWILAISALTIILLFFRFSRLRGNKEMELFRN